MKVAAIQFAPRFKDPRENVARMMQLVKAAVTGGARLVVLPELATTGYSFMSPEEAAPFAEELQVRKQGFDPARSMDVMPFLAKRWGVHIVWGLIERDPVTKKLYNSQAYVSPDGTVVGYRKVNLWGNDFIWANEGEANPPVVHTAIDGKERKIGLLICRDVRDKRGDESASFYEKGDADIVCFSANWGDGGFPAVAWMDFVKSNATYLIVANRFGQEGPNNFGEGGACVITPTGRVNCKGLVWNRDSIVYAEIP